MKAKIISIASQKGGVGKTTTVVSIGGILVQMGYRVLLVDVDPNASMTSYFRLTPERSSRCSYALFQDKAFSPSKLILQTEVNKLDLIPACSALAMLERDLGLKQGMGTVLQKNMEKFVYQYDFILIDSPPTLGLIMINVIYSGDVLVVPVQTEYLALQGLAKMDSTIEMIKKTKPEVNWHVLPTMYDRRTNASRRSLRDIKERYGDYLHGDVISVDTKLRNASMLSLPVSHLDGYSRSHEQYHHYITNNLVS
ncbi:MAG: ParA family protein [Gammaproteobacteria bacterium]|nr:ParA family protein [Gammaproteobacteria bacterium]